MVTENGGFVFHGLGNGDVIYCEMTSEKFPGLTLRTTPLAITGAVTPPPVASITTPAAADPGSITAGITELAGGRWSLDYTITVTYEDGTTEDFIETVTIPKNGSGTVDMGDYVLIYDIKGNGKNVKDFRIVKKEN